MTATTDVRVADAIVAVPGGTCAPLAVQTVAMHRAEADSPDSETPRSAPSRMLAVWTRELDVTERVGRVNVARKVRDALQQVAHVSNRRLTNAFEEQRSIWPLFAAAGALLSGLMSGRLLPLQCALFAAGSRRAELLADGLAADVVYLDGIRTLLLMRRLRRAKPHLRIVVDLDDLMSRRYEHLGSHGISLPLGYIERMVPRFLSRLAVAKNVSRVIFWYEARALRNAEAEVLRLADAVVLLNSTEAATLEKAGAGDLAKTRAKVVSIRPMANPVRPTMQSPFGAAATDWHAIFVGSDMLVQNRLTIAYLLDLWSTFQIETKLRIFGRQQGPWPAVANVTFCGYIANIADAYKPGSFLVYPCFVPGGIKTKVLEAFAYRVPVVGNDATFEDILPDGYPLVIDDKATLVALLRDPKSAAEQLTRASQVASAYLTQEHSATSFQDKWRDVMLVNAEANRPNGDETC